MTLTLEQLKSQTLGGSYGNPPPLLVRNEGTFIGQCVSYIRQGWLALYDLDLGIQGDAVNYWNNPIILKYFDQVTDGSKQDGDTLVWGKGSMTSQYGHIALWYQGKLLNQNFNNSLKVTTNDFFPQGYLGALRLKGVHMSFEDLQQLSQYVLLRPVPVTRAWYDSNPPEKNMSYEEVTKLWGLLKRLKTAVTSVGTMTDSSRRT